VSALSKFSLILIFYNLFVFILKQCLRQEIKINKKIRALFILNRKQFSTSRQNSVF